MLALASIVTVALTTWGHTGDTVLGAVDQLVALVAITQEVIVQHTQVHCRQDKDTYRTSKQWRVIHAFFF